MMTAFGAAPADPASWETVLAYGVPAVTAFGGAMLGAWLRGRQERRGRREDEHRTWRTDAADYLPHLDEVISTMDRRVVEASVDPDGVATIMDELMQQARSLEVLGPFLYRARRLHLSESVRGSAHRLHRAILLLPMRLVQSSHPSLAHAKETVIERAISEVELRSEEFAVALREGE